MAYQRQTFTDFDENNPLCARHLNHIENGIVEIENKLDEATPVRGVDYWTEEDKAEIVNDVLLTLPDAAEVDF